MAGDGHQEKHPKNGTSEAETLLFLSIYLSFLSYPILSYPIPSYPILSYPIPSYPILSYPILLSIYLSIYLPM